MYGTIAKMMIKEGALEEIRKMETGRQPEGYISSLVFQSDDHPNEVWLIAIFRDKDTYFANAQSPEQDQEYNRLRALLTSDPEWHDGEVVFTSEVSQ